MERNHPKATRNLPLNQQDLKRSILESAFRGHQLASQTQKDLDEQGNRLKLSLGETAAIKDRSEHVSQSANILIDEREKGHRLGRCLSFYLCPCFRSSQSQSGPARATSPIENESDADSIASFGFNRLKKETKEEQKQEARFPAWKRTFATYRGPDVWLSQVDASLMQFQRLAHEMSESLDEQIKLAQLLTVYLNHGVEQVVDTSQNLQAKESLF